MSAEEGFKAGSAYLDLDTRDQTAEGLRRIKEKIERGDHLAIPTRLNDPDESAFREKLLAALKELKPQIVPTLGDPVTPKWKQETDEKTRQYTPPPIKTTATDPIDAAWRARVQASIKAISSDAIKIPMVPETAKYREELELAVGELNSSLRQKVPVDMDGADQFRLHVEELAKEVSAEVKAKIPVEVDRDKAKKDAESAAGDIGKSFTAAFGNGIAPMPALIGAAVLAGAPLVGGAMIGIAGAGMAAAAATIASGSPDVIARWQALGDKMLNSTEQLRPRLSAPISGALDEISQRFDALAPMIGNTLISAESAVKPLADGLLGLMQNVLPGLSLAVANQGPVMQGFKSLLIDTGKAVGDTFESFSAHSKAFGTDTASLGSIVRSTMGLITDIVNQTGEAWAANSGQITGAIGQLMGGLSQLTSSVIPALASELANVLSVFGLLAQGIGAMEHAVGPLAGDLTALALSAKLLGVNLIGIPKLLGELPDKLAAVAAGTGKFAGAAGMAAEVLPVVGSAAAAIAAPLGLAAVYMSSVAQHQQDIVDSGTALGQSMVKGGTAAADAAVKMHGLHDNVDSLNQQLASATQSQNRLTDSIEYGRGGSSTAGNVTKSYRDNIADLEKELQVATKAEEDYKQQLGPLGVAQAQAAQAQKDYTDAVNKFGAASPEAEAAAKSLAHANAEVTSQQQNLNNAMSLTKASMGTFSKPAVMLQADLAKIGDAASSDSEKITAMKDALIKLSGGAIPIGDAMEALNKTMSTVATQMASGINHAEGYGKALLNADGSVRTITKNGQSLRDTMTTLRGQFVDAAAAIVAEDEAQGKSAASAKAHAQAVLEQQVPAIEKLGEKMGLTKAQVDAALKSMGAWPADLVTVVATPGVIQAQQAMGILKGKVLDVPNDHTVHTQALTDAAVQSLRDLGLVVTTLPNGTVTITGNTDLARAAANTLIRDINGMTAYVTVNAKGNADSLHVQGSRVTANATGNLFVPMAEGGFGGQKLTPMSNAVAQVVAPNTWRVSGDRKDVPELFAPLDGSTRSASLITQAAQHEHLSVGGQRSVTINQTVITSDPQQAADRAAGAVAWAMSSARG